MIYYTHFLLLMNYGIIFWGNSSYSNRVFKLQKRVVRIITGSVSSNVCHDLFKNLTLPSQYFFSFYVLLLQPVISMCLTQRYIEEILDKLQIFINQYQIYHCIKKEFWIKLNNNLPSFIKRILNTSNEFKSLLRNVLYFSSLCTLDIYFNHNTSWWLYINILAIAV